MTEEEKNTLKINIIDKMIERFYNGVCDGSVRYWLDNSFAEKADMVFKGIQSVIKAE